MEGSADDDHRMRPHDVDHSVPTKFPKVVGTNHRVVVMLPDVIYSRLEFNQIVDVGFSFSRPVHPTNDAAQRKPSRSIAARDSLECLQHSLLIKSAIAEVSVSVGSNFQLAIAFGGRWINSCSSQPLHMLASLIRIDYVNRLVAASESVLNKGQEDAIFFIVAVEECTDVTGFCQLGTCKGNGGRGAHRDSFPRKPLIEPSTVSRHVK